MEQQQAASESKRVTRSPARNLNELPDWAYLSRGEVARILGIDVTTVTRQVKAGNLPAPGLVAGKPRWRVDIIKAL